MDKENFKSSDPLTTEKFALANSLSLCCSNYSLPLSSGRFDSEMYPLFLINENFHSAKNKKKIHGRESQVTYAISASKFLHILSFVLAQWHIVLSLFNFKWVTAFFLFYWSHLQFVKLKLNITLMENCIDNVIY